MQKRKFLPIDLGDLEKKAQAIVNAFDSSNNYDRSNDYRKKMLQDAESIAKSLVRDFAYYMDTTEIGGIIPLGLDEKEEES